MRTWVRRQFVRLGLWLAALGGWTVPVCQRPHVPDEAEVAHARVVVADVQQRFADTSGEYRRREALRVLLNHYPQARERDLNLLIEVALQ